MKKSSQFFINFKDACKLEGLVHVYMIDLKQTIIDANGRQLEVAQEVLGVNKKDFIGSSIQNCLKMIMLMLYVQRTVL
jgi:hypothetical protein